MSVVDRVVVSAGDPDPVPDGWQSVLWYRAIDLSNAFGLSIRGSRPNPLAQAVVLLEERIVELERQVEGLRSFP